MLSITIGDITQMVRRIGATGEVQLRVKESAVSVQYALGGQRRVELLDGEMLRHHRDALGCVEGTISAMHAALSRPVPHYLRYSS